MKLLLVTLILLFGGIGALSYYVNVHLTGWALILGGVSCVAAAIIVYVGDYFHPPSGLQDTTEDD